MEEKNMAALHVTKENFETEVLNSHKPVLVDFWAAWCGPCQMMGPVIEELSEEVTDVKFAKLNVDEEPELAAQFGVMSIPTLILMKNGREEKKSIGAIPKQAVLDFIK